MKKLALLFLVFFVISSSFAQQINLTDKLPMDPNVKVGKLKNGLTYYIRKNVEPKNRAELRLVVKAGSILETESQRGLAHFMEHMNFNGTKNFPKNELVNFLEKSGIKFGADLNAYTSFDETVYMLPVPTDTLAKFEKFLAVLADWSGNATLDPSEVDKERGVILEEGRLRKGAGQRMQEKLYPVLFRGSRYADRLPIGLESVIENAPYKEFNQFKKDWYRPNLEAVIAVGDFDPAIVEQMIKKQFGGFKNPRIQKQRLQYKVPLNGGTDAIVITDKEQPYTIVQLFYLQPERKEITAENKRDAIIRSLFNTMISRRLSELQQQANPPFMVGLSSYSSFIAGLDALNTVAVAKGTDVENALIAVLDANNRAAQFGFTNGELERAKLSYKTSVEKQFAEKDKTASSAYIDELIKSFTNGGVMTDIVYDKAFVDQYLDGIKVNEVNDFVKSVITKENRVLAVLAPESAKDKLPGTDKLKELLNHTGSTLTPYVDEVVSAGLIKNVPAAGKITQEKTIQEVGVTEITFENGIKVSLKPTTFKNDEIVFRGVRWGGTSLYSDADFDNASLASFVASNSGNGTLTSPQLTKYLSGKVARVNVSLGGISENISGMSTVKDVETALQMLYNKFTNNHLDKEVVTGAIATQRDLLVNSELTPTPEKVYSDTLQTVLSNGHFRARPMTSKRFAEVNPEKAMEIFSSRLADASDFEFVFVGNFEIEKIKPLLATYLGSLPTSGKTQNFKDLNIHPTLGKLKKVVKKGTEDKANVTLILSGDYKADDTEEELMTALGEILQIKLTEKLREEEGSVYSPYASMSYSRFPSPKYQLFVGFGCAPNNVEKLIALSMEEIKKIRENGAGKEDIEKFVTNEKLNFQTNLKNNNYWLNVLMSKYQNGEDIREIPDADKYLDKVTVETTKIAAQKYFKDDNFIQVILLPEK